jgi:hypothetical protein
MLKAIICVCILSFVNVTAQEQNEQEAYHQIGVSGSTISGYGISYHYIFSDNYRMKFTGFYLFEGASRTEYDYDATRVSFGVEGQKTISKTNITRLYGFLGAGYNLKRGESRYKYFEHFDYADYSGGAGLGIELLAASHIVFGLNLGLVYSFEGRKFISNAVGNSYRSNVSLGFGGGLNLGFQF